MKVSTPTIHFNLTSSRVTAADMSGTDGEIELRRPQYKDLTLFWQIVPVFILLFGILGNVMIIVICRRANVMSSMSVYFIILAGSDLMSLIVSAANQWVYYMFDIDVTSLNSFACKLIVWAGYVTGVLSAWILVAMTVQRAVCVLWPHRADILCSARNSKAIALSMSLFTAVLHSHLLYGLDVVTLSYGTRAVNDSAVTYSGVTHTNNTAGTFNDATHTAALCIVAGVYVELYFSVWGLVDLLIFSVLPWLCLVVSNSVLLWTLNVSIRQAQHSLGSAHTHGFSGRKKQASSITVILFAVSTAFIILNLPMSCVQVLGFYHYAVGSLDYYYQSEVIAYCDELALALWQTNSAVNFYLYCLTGSKFCRELKKMFGCASPGNTIRATTPSLTEETNFHKRKNSVFVS